MNLAQRKLVEALRKSASLDAEFTYWLGITAPGKRLEKHNTQVVRITGRLKPLQQRVSQQLEGLAHGQVTDSEILARCPDQEILILETHRIWEFFRDKLLLRESAAFSEYLYAADEFAWACYKPAVESVIPEHVPTEKTKEPPLVFLDMNPSPFAVARERAYLLPAAVGPQLLSLDALTAELKQLPIPVIGVPWYQPQHLSDALVIGHEVGHLVEEDLRLSDRLRTLLTDRLQGVAPSARLDAWLSWKSEIFADLYGLLATGPAFASALIDFLALAPHSIVDEEHTSEWWGAYPTAYLRILLVLQALEMLGTDARPEFRLEARKMREGWRGLFPTHRMPQFEADLPLVAGALLDGPYPEFGGKTLRQVLSFSPADHERAGTDATTMLETANGPASVGVRTLFAAARLAFERDPERYGLEEATNKVLRRVREQAETGPRSRADRSDPQVMGRIARQDKTEADEFLRRLTQQPAPRAHPGGGP